jgi:peroxiredoxin
MKTIGELRNAIAELPDNSPLGVEIQTNGGDNLEFTSVDGVDVSSEWRTDSGLTEEVKSVNLIVTSNK